VLCAAGHICNKGIVLTLQLLQSLLLLLLLLLLLPLPWCQLHGAAGRLLVGPGGCWAPAAKAAAALPVPVTACIQAGGCMHTFATPRRDTNCRRTGYILLRFFPSHGTLAN
jgi:hypothetical protein